MPRIGLILTFLAWASVPLHAQRETAQVYSVQVITQYGERFRGILYEVTDSLLYLREDPNALIEPRGSVIPLREVDRVILRKGVKRAPTLQGALIGAVGVGFLAFRSIQRSPLRSPVLTGLTFVTGVASGAGFGALLGSSLGRSPRRVVRARQAELDPARLSDLLRPFAYVNQLNRLYLPPEQ